MLSDIVILRHQNLPPWVGGWGDLILMGNEFAARSGADSDSEWLCGEIEMSPVQIGVGTN